LHAFSIVISRAVIIAVDSISTDTERHALHVV